jgi:triosephosphate isomerase
MRTPFIAANWKMYKTVHEAVVFVKEFRSMVKDMDDVEIVVAPPFTALHSAAEAARNSPIGIAAQNAHWEREGAFTGEISVGMVKEAGGDYVIIGHSERRRMFGETDDTVNRKVVATLAAHLTPIVCIGETLDQREAGGTLEVLDRQIKAGLDGLNGDQVHALVLAYEPVWAIGTGRNATPDDAAQVHELIRFELSRRKVAGRVTILYGGSVNQGNVLSLLARPEIDGVLVGGASLDADGWAELVGLGD